MQCLLSGFPLISRVRKSGVHVRAGSVLEQWLAIVIEPTPFLSGIFQGSYEARAASTLVSFRG